MLSGKQCSKPRPMACSEENDYVTECDIIASDWFDACSMKQVHGIKSPLR